MSTIDRLRAPVAGSRLTVPGVIGLAATIYLFARMGGAIGLAAGGGLLMATAVMPPVVVFALGQSLFLVVLPKPTLAQLLFVQLALFLFLLDAATRWRAVPVPIQLEYMVVRARSAAPGRYVPVALAALGAFAVLGAATLVVAARLGLFEAAAGLVAGVGAVGYVLHRYERVRLGLAGDGEAAAGAGSGPGDGAAVESAARSDGPDAARHDPDATGAPPSGDGGAGS